MHENLALGAVGVATAYAHGWADSYPAALWVLGAEGKKEILPLLGELCAELATPSPPARTNPPRPADAACSPS